MAERIIDILFFQAFRGIGPVKLNRDYLPLLDTLNGLGNCISLMKKTGKYSEDEINQAVNRAESIYHDIETDRSINVLTPFDSDYPKGLLNMGSQKPVILYVKGDKTVLHRKSIAVVGTREPDQQSKKACAAMADVITKQGVVVVSGLAEGCDKIAHDSCLNAGGLTIAVLPSGFSSIVPPHHEALANKIIHHGCLVSEYAPDVKPTNGSFIRRDSLIALLSSGVLAVQCSESSGTMHTMEAANGKRPMACYYPQHRGASYAGNELLISEMDAQKIIYPSDLKAFINKCN